MLSRPDLPFAIGKLDQIRAWFRQNALRMEPLGVQLQLPDPFEPVGQDPIQPAEFMCGDRFALQIYIFENGYIQAILFDMDLSEPDAFKSHHFSCSTSEEAIAEFEPVISRFEEMIQA